MYFLDAFPVFTFPGRKIVHIKRRSEWRTMSYPLICFGYLIYFLTLLIAGNNVIFIINNSKSSQNKKIAV